LIDMEIEPFLIASSLIGVVAQRLVRRICQDCKEADSPQGEVPKRFGVSLNGSWMRGKGCRKCSHTGYRGRIGIFEMMTMNEELVRLTLAKASTTQIRSQAVSQGMKTLRDDGIQKATSGVTTMEEVLRVTQET